ncbi:MAG: class I tRNA ligase family protein [Candidatus Hodgkinia cicadicola]
MLLRRYGFASAHKFWAWKKQIAKVFLVQLERLLSRKLLGRTRFTLDALFKAAVACAFTKLWKNGVVMPRRRLVAWDSSVECLVSDLETFRSVEYAKQLYWKFVLRDSTSLVWRNAWVASNYVTAVRPLAETSVFAAVLTLSCLCNCKLSSAELKDAASADTTAALVNAKDFVCWNLREVRSALACCCV